MDGHELNTAALADGWVGLREEPIELRVEGAGGWGEAGGRDGVEEREEDLGVLVSSGINGGGTTEGAPGALDPRGERGGFGLAPAEFEGAAEDGGGAGEAMLAIGGEKWLVAVD